MLVIPLNITDFRALFSAFQNNAAYPDGTIDLYWRMSTNYVSDRQYTWCVAGWRSAGQQTLAIQLMTAHLLAINDIIQNGDTPGVATGATIDKISVTLQPP